MTSQLSLSTKPRLPSAEAILPYLARIDKSRWYSNFGPLVREFEARLEMQFAAPPASVVTVANATAGLTLALRSLDIEGRVCLLPAWTFAATAVAVVNAGLTPYFVDVDHDSWQMTPAAAKRALRRVNDAAAVIVVAPFGAPLDMAAWTDFIRKTNIPVVVDAAASFDTAENHPELLSVVSLHTTKVLGVGEGGFILAGTAERGDTLRRMSNFGLDAKRLSIMPGGNAKLSEYAAAIGLAGLDQWSASRRAFLERAAAYRAHMIAARLLDHVEFPLRNYASATLNVLLREPCADELIAFMQARGIGARKWWADACHRHPAFSRCAHHDLSVTERLVRHVVALPFWIDMADGELRSVVDSASCFFRTRPG